MNTEWRWYHGQTEISDTFQPDYQLQGRRLLIRSFSARLKVILTSRDADAIETLTIDKIYWTSLLTRANTRAKVSMGLDPPATASYWVLEELLTWRTVRDVSRHSVSLTASSVLVDGVMEDVAVSVGDNASFTCKVQSQHSSLSVVWARRLQADQRLVPDTTFGLLHIGEDLYKVGSSLYKVLHILYL